MATAAEPATEHAVTDIVAGIAGHIVDISALFKKYSPDIFRFALYLCGDWHEAEDITSETFVRAWTTPDRIEAATVKAYLFTIARNLFLQELRKKPRRAELDEQLHDPQPDPEMQAGQKAELQSVLAKLQTLPEIDRTALLMRSLEGMPYEEIARTLAIPVTTAKVKVHRARLLLSEIRNL
jgi:RNA polymerase sigma factor (sigma-70 family)